jgi:hypothetical protein
MKLTKIKFKQMVEEELTKLFESTLTGTAKERAAKAKALKISRKRAAAIADPKNAASIYKAYIEKHHGQGTESDMGEEEINWAVGEIVKGKRTVDLGDDVHIGLGEHPETTRERTDLKRAKPWETSFMRDRWKHYQDPTPAKVVKSKTDPNIETRDTASMTRKQRKWHASDKRPYTPGTDVGSAHTQEPTESLKK